MYKKCNYPEKYVLWLLSLTFDVWNTFLGGGVIGEVKYFTMAKAIDKIN
jgi:hypothetical protein